MLQLRSYLIKSNILNLVQNNTTKKNFLLALASIVAIIFIALHKNAYAQSTSYPYDKSSINNKKHHKTYPTIRPFFGMDIGQSRITLKERFGKKMFRKNSTTYNFFVGLDFNDSWGIELGYERDNPRKSDNVKYFEGEYPPGSTNPIRSNNPNKIKNITLNFTNIKFKYNNFSLGIFKKAPINNFFFIEASINIKIVKIYAKYKLSNISAFYLPENTTININFNNTYTYMYDFVALAPKLGIIYKKSKYTSIRFQIDYLFKDNKTIQNSTVNNKSVNYIKINSNIKIKLGIILHLDQ